MGIPGRWYGLQVYIMCIMRSDFGRDFPQPIQFHHYGRKHGAVTKTDMNQPLMLSTLHVMCFFLVTDNFLQPAQHWFYIHTCHCGKPGSVQRQRVVYFK